MSSRKESFLKLLRANLFYKLCNALVYSHLITHRKYILQLKALLSQDNHRFVDVNTSLINECYQNLDW